MPLKPEPALPVQESVVRESRVYLGDSDEVEAMAESLGISFAQFATRYTYREEGQFSLKEVQRPEGDFACIFFDRGCKIYEVRPEQCRTFPFWDIFVAIQVYLKGECPRLSIYQPQVKDSK